MTATLLMASLTVADITRSLLVVFRYKKQAHSQLHFVWGGSVVIFWGKNNFGPAAYITTQYAYRKTIAGNLVFVRFLGGTFN